MPYASVSDVQALAPHVPLNAQSKPSLTDVQRWIDETETLVDSVLRTVGWQTPITGSESLKIVRRIVAHGVMAQVMRARPNAETDPDKFQAVFDRMLKSLEVSDDPLDLPDAIALDTPLKSQTGFRVSSNFKEIARDPDVGIRVTRDLKF